MYRLLRKTASRGREALSALLREAPASQRREWLLRFVREEVRSVLRLREPPSLSVGFFDLGMDSVTAVELRGRLNRALGGSYVAPDTVAFDHPSVEALTRVLRSVLGLDTVWRVALLGAGRIGTALFEYEPFRRRGFHITTVIDNDPAKVGKHLGHIRIRGEDELECALGEERIDLVILAVPAPAAQGLVDRVVAAGVKAVLNYAPVQLRLPGDVALRNVSMLVELESLSHALTRAGCQAARG